MKVEVLTNSEFDEIVQALNTDARCVYKCPEDIYGDHPYYEIWEVEKSNIQEIETACMFEDVLFCYSNGANRGTPFECLTIHGEFVIGWTAVNDKDRFDCLTDYFIDGLGITDSDEVCACSVTMAKTNGWSLAQLWNKLEG
jgi:hypothetical protein